MVLPYEGKVTALSTQQVRGTKEEKLCQDRGIDLRIARGPWSATIIDAMKEANLGQGRIGVTDLEEVPGRTEGEVTYTTSDRVLKAFPQAKFEAASYLIDGVAALHSAEEIAVLKNRRKSGSWVCRRCLRRRGPG